MLTIAGFDPSSGAGMTADLAVFAAHGCFGVSCITALTVQSTIGVRGVEPVRARVVQETLESLWDDLPASGIKIGMLASAENVEAVGAFLEGIRGTGVPVVLDPVLRSSSGRVLLEDAGVEVMKRLLLPLVDWITPNLAELEVLSGTAEMEVGARRLQEKYPGLGVVVTGGHSAGDAVDDLVLAPDRAIEWLRGERVPGKATHGTGCAFSSAMTCGLSEGLGGVKSGQRAKTYVAEAIRRAEPRGAGNGPMELLWPLRR